MGLFSFIKNAGAKVFGIGKTTAFVKYFPKARPNSRLLFLVPLTVIADQIFKSDSNNKITVLTGSSPIDDYDSARSSKIVVATYEQGFNILCKDYKFDYLVVDEIHGWISSMSFKSDIISPLVKLTEDFKIIGLTGCTTSGGNPVPVVRTSTHGHIPTAKNRFNRVGGLLNQC